MEQREEPTKDPSNTKEIEKIMEGEPMKPPKEPSIDFWVPQFKPRFAENTFSRQMHLFEQQKRWENVKINVEFTKKDSP